jgi:S1-C subfamily serine protease
MTGNDFRRGTIFLGVSVGAGLALALLAAHLWPGLVNRKPMPTGAPTPAVAPMTGTAPATAPVAARLETPARTPATTEAHPTDGAVSAPSGAPEQTTAPPVASFAPAVRASAPAVVNIFAERKVTEQLPPSALEQLLPGRALPRYRQRVQQSLGSGVIVDSHGHIVTNHHVVAGADKIQVQLADGRNAVAEVVGRDPDTDLAVLRIALDRLPVMQLGRSDHLQVGDIVLAIGSPLGLAQTVTHGIVSATGRAQLGVATFENFIQTDAAINEGNSGGALVNVRGELIGINTAVLGKNRGAEGLSVAIPVGLVRGVMREILAKGRVVRGWIGIIPTDAEPERAAQLGYPQGSVVIDDLYLDSPAIRAGIAINDRIVSIDGRPVRSGQDALTLVATHKPGSTVKVAGLRGTQPFAVELPVIETPRTR